MAGRLLTALRRVREPHVGDAYGRRQPVQHAEHDSSSGLLDQRREAQEPPQVWRDPELEEHDRHD